MATVILSPAKYVQGAGELSRLGGHIGALGSKFFVLLSESGMKRVSAPIQSSMDAAEKQVHFESFNRECSKNEVRRLIEKLKATGCDAIIGVGGGKTLDTAKAVAHYAGLPVIIVPTIASTDAPCSALSVLYTEEGVFEEYLFLPANPNAVIVDTQVVASAPARLLIAGMGDALATYFEGRAAVAKDASNCGGGKATLAAQALSQLCYETLLKDGLRAKLALEAGALTKAVENIIEANTLLSGIGFESCGLAAAHAIHNGFTVLADCHHLYHGEKVAFGTLTQLVLENAPEEELAEVIDFCQSLGLPTTLAEMNLGNASKEDLYKVAVAASVDSETIHNMPFAVNADMVYSAILAADALGRFYQ